MKVTYLQYIPPNESRVGQTVCFNDTEEGEYFILNECENWRVWTVIDNKEYSYMIKHNRNPGWKRWTEKLHSDNTDCSKMLIWSYDQVIKAGVPLLEV